VNRVFVIGLTVTLFMTGAWGAGARHGAAANHAVPMAPSPLWGIAPFTGPDGTAPATPGAPAPTAGEAAEGARDLFGNEVSDAIATYTRDRAGSVYEEHSPGTEVPRLKPPTT
jgi:hypothetical protein